jgi:hypothetical protein
MCVCLRLHACDVAPGLWHGLWVCVWARCVCVGGGGAATCSAGAPVHCVQWAALAPPRPCECISFPWAERGPVRCAAAGARNQAGELRWCRSQTVAVCIPGFPAKAMSIVLAVPVPAALSCSGALLGGGEGQLWGLRHHRHHRQRRGVLRRQVSHQQLQVEVGCSAECGGGHGPGGGCGQCVSPTTQDCTPSCVRQGLRPGDGGLGGPCVSRTQCPAFAGGVQYAEHHHYDQCHRPCHI